MQDISFVVAHADVHIPSLRSKFHGITNKIPQDLAQTRSVGDHFMRQRKRGVQHKMQAFLLRLQAGEVFQVGQEAGKVHRLVIQLNFTPLHLIHLNNIIEDITQRYR